MNDKKPNFAERLLKVTDTLQKKAHSIPKEKPSAIYGDISNRMFALTLDLCVTILPMYYITKVIIQIFYHGQEYMFTAIEKVHSAVSPELYHALQSDMPSMLTYIFEHYPQDAAIIVQQVVTIKITQFIIYGFYAVPFLYKFGATPGKMILGLRVVDNITKDRLTLSQTVIRYLSYITIPIGVFYGGMRKNKRCLHDLIADTVVIYSPSRWYKRHANMLLNKVRAFFNLPTK